MRNWDYRYCWLRDAAMTLFAFMRAGLLHEAASLGGLAAPERRRQPGSSCRSCTASRGERRLTEWEVPWLPGYEGAAPVRVGNAAAAAAAAGRLRRGHAARCTSARRSRAADGLRHLGAAARDAGALRDDLARAGRRDVGDARRPAAFHLQQGHGLGRLRPRHRDAEQHGLDGPLDAGAPSATRSTRPSAARASMPTRNSFVQSASATRARREPAADPAGRLPAGRRPAGDRHRGRDRARPDRGRLRAALPHRGGRATACRPARARSWPAPSGWPRRCTCRAATTRRARCSSGCSACATTSACSPRSTTRRQSAFAGNFPQAFSHVALVAAALILDGPAAEDRMGAAGTLGRRPVRRIARRRSARRSGQQRP